MKATIQTLWILAVFTLVVGVIYGFVTGFHEWAGFPALLAVAAMSAFLAVYLQLTLKNAGATLPEDDLEGEIVESAGDYGHFSPWSWWPLLLGIGCAISFTALAIAPWMMMFAAPVALLGVFGLVMEHSTGEHAH